MKKNIKKQAVKPKTQATTASVKPKVATKTKVKVVEKKTTLAPPSIKVKNRNKIAERVNFLRSLEKEVKFWNGLLKKVKDNKSLKKDVQMHSRVVANFGLFVQIIISGIENYVESVEAL